MIIPNKLRIGDTIGVVAPSNPIISENIEEIQKAKEIVEKLGFKVTQHLKYYLCGIDYKILYYNIEENNYNTKDIIDCMSNVYEGVLRDKTKLVMEEKIEKI